MAIVVRTLWVKQGNLNLPGRSTPFWGFASSAAAPPTLPGPIIEVTAGDLVFMRLRNNTLAELVSLMFPGQTNVWAIGREWGWRRVSPQYENGRMVSLTDYLEPGRATLITYMFEAISPGIYLYESGTNPERQVQMGLYGAMIVRPTGYTLPFSPNYKTAYGGGTGTRFDIERVLIIGEIDTVMHEALARGNDYNIIDFSPDYWIINGRSYPDTIRSDRDPLMPGQPSGSAIRVRVGQRLLLRLINAGFQNHAIHFGGLVGRIVAGDSYPFISSASDVSYQKMAITLGSGQSFDIIIIPESPGEFFICDRDYNHLVNGDSFPGGMMTKVTVTS